MGLEISENLYLDKYDSNNMCLYRVNMKKDKGTGEEVAVKDYLRYYPNLEYALRDILKSKLMDTELTADMTKVLRTIEEYKVLAKKLSKNMWRIYEE